MTPYEMLFADQDLAEVLLAAEFPSGSKLDAARARMWEGDAQETASFAQGAPEPWASFLIALARLNAGGAPQPQLRAVAEDAFQEARPRLWAWTALRKLGEKPAPVFAQELLGIIVELMVDGGLDVLATYADGSIRFLGHADQLLAREADGQPTPAAAALLSEAYPLLAIPPKPRDKAAEPPPPDHVRLTALSASGVHQVEVPMADINDGGRYERLFKAATVVLQEITEP